MKDRTRPRPTIEDLQRQLERTRVQIREVERPARRPPALPPSLPPARDLDPERDRPSGATLH